MTPEQLETEVTRALTTTYRNVNSNLFGDTLRAPVISLVENPFILGQWLPESREIRLQHKMAFEKPWSLVEEVLKHEMAHQFVDEVLEAHGETAHGPAFRTTCEQRGIDPKAFGAVAEGQATPDAKVFKRVSKLLALASSANQHEAELAMNKAQELMRLHNVQAVKAGLPREYRFVQMHKPMRRVFEPDRWLAAIISEYFFVDVIWISAYDSARGIRGRVLEICGSPENLAIAEYVHGFLSQTADRLWIEHKTARGIKRNRDRQKFRTGVMRGFREKLKSQQRQSEQEGLVWVEDADLMRYMHRRHPRVNMVRRGGSADNEATRAGQAAGRGIVLNKPVSSGGSSRGRLLGSGQP